MPPARSSKSRKGDKATFYKALLVEASLTDAARRVGAVLVDYFNVRTGQCDPGTETLSAMTGLERKTIFAATKVLVDIGLFQKTRHGGHGHRNDYQPNFNAAADIVTNWERRKSARHKRTVPESNSPVERDFDSAVERDFDSPVERDTKPEKKTRKLSQREETQTSSGQKHRNGLGNEGARHGHQSYLIHSLSGGKETGSRNASREQAEKRIHDDILAKRPDRHQLFVVIAGNDSAPYQSAIRAEMKRRGAGAVEMIAYLDRDAAEGAGNDRR